MRHRPILYFMSPTQQHAAGAQNHRQTDSEQRPQERGRNHRPKARELGKLIGSIVASMPESRILYNRLLASRT
jgi:hypothetical protein